MSLRSGDEIQEALRSFIGRWGNYAGTERSEAQTFLNELFAAYGADRKEVARFEDPQGSGGIVDCLYPGVAIIEMKRPGEADRLAGHRAQALEYWHHSDDPVAGLAAARFVVLCAFQRFEVWEPGRFPSAPLDSFDLAELPDRYEALYFLADEEPLFLAHRRRLTTDAAAVVGRLYERRSGRASPDEISQIRYFVLQLVWCLFAESLGLLGGDPVEQIVEALIADPRRSSAAELGHLFSVLATTDQSARGGLYHGAPYVNGGLFASPARVHLDPDELALVVEAARFDWRDVDPTIFGSLMEGCLGEQRRFELGAHYTHEIDILRIVRPSIIEPWTERIAAAGTPAEMVAILDELCALQVLDPACGCGNFLYVAYREIRRLEHDAKTRVAELAASTGLPGPETLPSYAISHLHGIEVDEFTAMIARVTLWMGHKLVTDAYGAVEPVLPLVDLSGIVVGDALRVEWPAADVIIGNPPFHGSQHLRQALGDDYVEWLKRTFKCGVQDYCVYWFRRAADNLASDGRAGLVGTNSISQNKARVAGLDYVVGRGGVITAAVSTEKWPGDAKVHVSLVNWVQRPTILPEKFVLDEVRVSGISTSLRPSDDLPDPVALGGNAGFAFQGPIPVGEGFVLTAEEAHALLSDGRAPYTRVVRPYLVSEDIADDPQQHPRRWIIDFASMSLEEAERFPAALQLVRERVKPTRDKNSDRGFRELWWRFGRPRGEMRAALYGLRRYIAGTRVGKRPLFVWCENEWCPGDAVNVFGFEDDCVTRTQGGIDVEDRTHQAVLHQRWRSALRDRPAGGGPKPPQAASVKSRGGERCGQGAPRVRQVRAGKASESEPPMTCRKRSDDIETGRESFSRDEPGGNLPTAQAVSGIKAARAQLRLWCGTCEPVAPIPTGRSLGRSMPPGRREGEPQVAGTTRGRVPMRSTGADRLAVVMKPGNAGGAKGAGHPGGAGGQS